MLGDLSSKYESNGDPGTISDGAGDMGGQSYGCYQFAITQGIPQDFVSWLGSTFFGNTLSQYEVGTQEFNDNWSMLAERYPNEFIQAQHEYVKHMYFDKAVENLREVGFDVLSRSEALQQVLFSRSVQYSANYMVELFQSACDLAGRTLETISDRELIYYIYEVNLTDMSWSSGSPSLRSGLFARFESEREDAIAMLESGVC